MPFDAFVLAQFVHSLRALGVAALLLGLAAVPGWAALAALGLAPATWRLWRHVGLWPVAALTGWALWPLALTWLGIARVALPWPLRALALLAVTGGLVVLAASRRAAAAALPPVFLARRGAAAFALLVAMVLFGALWPLSRHGVPVGTTGWMAHITAYDWAKHHGVVNALLSNDRLPPPNPFLAAEPRLHYTAFAYLPASDLLRALPTRLTVADALNGLVLAVIVMTLGAHGVVGRTVGLPPRVAVGSSALTFLVGGLDFGLLLAARAQNGWWLTHADGWISHGLRRINMPLSAFVWVPQHVQGVGLALLVLALAVRVARDGPRAGAAACGLALMLAGLFGTSALVAFGVGMALAAWWALEALLAVLRAPGRVPGRALRRLALAGLGGLALAWPMLSLLAGRGEGSLTLALTPMLRGWWEGAPASMVFGAGTWATLLDFVPQMFVEYGLVLPLGALGVWAARRTFPTDPAARLGAIALVACALIVLLVREARPDTNNYAPRVGALGWALLGLWGGVWWVQRRVRVRRWGWALGLLLMGIGLASSAYEPIMLRRTNGLLPPGWARAYAWLAAHTAPDDVYQSGPASGPNALMFVPRRTAFSDSVHAEVYASDTRHAARAEDALRLAYTTPDAAVCAAVFGALRAGTVLITPSTPLPCRADPAFATHFDVAATFDDGALVVRLRASVR